MKDYQSLEMFLVQEFPDWNIFECLDEGIRFELVLVSNEWFNTQYQRPSLTQDREVVVETPQPQSGYGSSTGFLQDGD